MTTAEDWGTWEEAERRKHLKGLELTAEERLAWLDEMIELARAHGAGPKPRDAWRQRGRHASIPELDTARSSRAPA